MAIIPWSANWHAHGWALSAQRRDAMIAVISEKVSGLQGQGQEEIDLAVESLCSQIEGGSKSYAPTVRQIVAEIYKARDKARGYDVTVPADVRIIAGNIKRMHGGTTDRWEAIMDAMFADKTIVRRYSMHDRCRFAEWIIDACCKSGGLVVPFFVPADSRAGRFALSMWAAHQPKPDGWEACSLEQKAAYCAERIAERAK